LSDQEIQFGETYLKEQNLYPGKTLVGIHPGSSTEHMMIHKRWPSARFSELTDNLENHNAKVLIFGGPEEEELMEQVKQSCSSSPLIIKGLTIRETASVIRQCSLFISNDSGLMHIAVSMNVKTIGIFGPTDHVRTAPYGKRHKVVRKGEPSWKLEDVGFRSGSIEEASGKMEDVSVNDVLRAAEELLEANFEIY